MLRYLQAPTILLERSTKRLAACLGRQMCKEGIIEEKSVTRVADINQPLKVIINNLRFILIFTLIIVGGLYFYLRSLTPLYESTATIFINQNTPTQTLDISALSVSQQFSETFSRIAKTNTVLDEVANDLSINSIDPKRVTVASQPKTQLIKVIVRDPQAQVAADIANQIVIVLKQKVADLQQSINPTSQVVIETVEKANPDQRAVFPRVKQSIAVGLFAGLIIAILLVYLTELFDHTITDENDILEILPYVPVVGVLPYIKRGDKNNALVEAMHELRTNFSYLRPDKPPRLIVITSSFSSEGKTFTSLELAKSIARSEKKVLLIDCDLRRAGLTKSLGIKRDLGLADALYLGSKITDIATKKYLEGKLEVIPAGKEPVNPGELFSSKRADAFFQSLKDSHKYDLIILDTPPTNAVADAATIATKVDGVLITVEANRTTKQHLKDIEEIFRAVKTDIMGIIINKGKINRRKYQYGYY